ncbi:hypothetical protein Tco_0625049 [Tanacetum coccineum]|uniref:Uncharacterized protein n=1 Tax=Tanacetum coccineum TaxID=301880 RepID=A0ABQ4WFS5_9ASTR
MDDPNITMEEYIRLEEEKARRRGKVYNWQTSMYGKIWDNEDVHDLGSVETEFPAIVFNDELTSEEARSCELRETSLSECDKEEQNVLYFNDLFPFNVIYPDDSKSNKDNDNDKIDIEQPLGDMFVIPLPNERSERNDNVGGAFINLEISKCWSLEISRRLFNTLFCSTTQLGESSQAKHQGVPRFNYISHII